MPSNDFLKFATGGGAAVVSQATYAAAATLLANGFQIGIADENYVNKVWRQSSIMSQVIGDLIVTETGQNVVDDGTTATILANLILAIKAIVANAGNVYNGNPNGNVAGSTALTGGLLPSLLWDYSNNVMWICTTTGNAAGAVWSPISQVEPVTVVTGANLTYAKTHFAKVVRRSNGGVAMADTLPAAGTVLNGWWTSLFNYDTVAAMTVTAPGATKLNGVVGGSITLTTNQCASIAADVNGDFLVIVAPPQLASALGGGATVTNPMTANVTLTAASTRLQTIYPTVSGLAVVLPNASSMGSLGGPQFIVENRGVFPVQIQDFTNALIGWAVPGQNMPILIESQGTTAGVWRMASGDISKDNGINWYGTVKQLIDSAGIVPVIWGVIPLSPTTGILFYQNSSGAGTFAEYSYADQQIQIVGSQATSKTITATSSSTIVDMTWVSATRMLVAMAQVTGGSGSGTYIESVDYVTNSSPTENTELLLESVASGTSSVTCDVIPGTTRGFVAYSNSNIPTLTARMIDIGSTITPYTTRTLGSTWYPQLKTRALSATLAHLVYGDGSTNFIVAAVLSGTAQPTFGTPVTLTSRSMLPGSPLIRINATTTGMIVFDTGGKSYAQIYSDNGAGVITVTEKLLEGLTANAGGVLPKNFILSESGVTMGFGLGSNFGSSVFFPSGLQTVKFNGNLTANIAVGPIVPYPPEFQQRSQYFASNVKALNGNAVFPFNANYYTSPNEHFTQQLKPLALAY